MSVNDLIKLVKLPDEVNILKIVSVVGKNLYLIYRDTLTIGEMIKNIEDNYYPQNFKAKYHFSQSIIDFKLFGNYKLKNFVKQDEYLIISSDDSYKKKNKYNYDNDHLETLRYLHSEPEGELYIKTLSGNKYIIPYYEKLTIIDIKDLIYEQLKIPPDEQRLSYKRFGLQDDLSLYDYGIKCYSEINLVLRLRGGMYNETSGKLGNFEPLKDCIIIANNDPELSKLFNK